MRSVLQWRQRQFSCHCWCTNKTKQNTIYTHTQREITPVLSLAYCFGHSSHTVLWKNLSASDTVGCHSIRPSRYIAALVLWWVKAFFIPFIRPLCISINGSHTHIQCELCSNMSVIEYHIWKAHMYLAFFEFISTTKKQTKYERTNEKEHKQRQLFALNTPARESSIIFKTYRMETWAKVSIT